MRYPTLEEQKVTQQITQTFYGLDRSERIRDGAWAYAENGTCDKFPTAATRERRKYVPLPENPRCFTVYRHKSSTGSLVRYATIAKDTTSQITPQLDRVFLNGTIVSNDISSPYLTDHEKHIVQMGEYLYIFPKKTQDTDKPLQCNADNTENTKFLSASFSFTGVEDDAERGISDLHFYPCTADGVNMPVFWRKDAEPTPPTGTNPDKYGWIDVSGETPTFKQYSKILEDFIPVSQTYLKLNKSTIGVDFSEGDYISISGAETDYVYPQDNTGASSYTQDVIASLNTENSVYRIAKVESNYIVIETNGKQIATSTRCDLTAGKTITIERKVPLMDFVIAGRNRIWGCSSDKNEIYCCKLGDPSNWYSYEGLSTDSYAVTVGGEKGPFTGAVFMGDNPVFFKENAVIRIYGTQPSNFRLDVTSGNGVALESEKSAALVGNVCYYLSQSGVRRYDGSTIEDVGGALGGGHKNGVAAATGKKYYLTAQRSDDTWERLCYDVEKGLWMREDATPALYGASWGDFAAFVENTAYPNSNDEICVSFQTPDAPVYGAGIPARFETENAFDWCFDTGIIGYSDPNEKYISRLNVRLSANEGASINVYIKYDSGEWEHKSSMTAYTRRSFTLPIRPRRCDHMQIRIAGHGDCVIYSIAKLYEQGSDVVR